MNAFVRVTVVTAVICGVAGTFMIWPKAEADKGFSSIRPAAPKPAAAQVSAPASAADVVPLPDSALPANNPIMPTKVAKASQSAPKPGTSAGQGTRPVKEPIKDPMARTALAFVGTDAAAEQYWYEAINDASLPANERKDLIEDLNEDGISDPENPNLDDLPLIVSRLVLIETVAQDAMDKVNADAFAEAYKDLSEMAKRLVNADRSK
ncbi:MAG: hypothetical protein WCO56_14155 [Verrucomicrobiota bacterium]